MASLCYLQPYVDEVHSKAVDLDVPSYVIDALRDILHGETRLRCRSLRRCS